MSSKAKRIAERIFLRWLPLGVLLAFVMIPLLWVLSLSFKYSSDVVSETFTVLPNPFTLSNYSAHGPADAFPSTFATASS